ncbi:MAG: ATP-binding protein [Elainella sp. Prado103]|jgi:hypothetical protein|nr:ATP-binding protein [Elainella sp. Prado103]
MNDFLSPFLSASSFIPHGHCYLWKPSLVWLHASSDTLIATAYYSIPVTLFYFVRKRRDLPFNWIFLLFAAFIVACGTTHLAEIWTLWYPTYWLSGGIKVITAGVSAFTAIQLVPLVPQALALPSPQQLEQTNRALQEQIQQRVKVEEKLRHAQGLLEQRVQERTAELMAANQQLQQEIEERQRTEVALRTSMEQLELTLSAAQMGNWSWEMATDVATLSEPAAKIFDIFPHLTPTWTEIRGLLVAEDRDRAQAAVAQSIANHSDYAIEYRVICQDQSIRWASAKGRAQYDKDGTPIGMLGVIQDITERKQAEEEREQLLERERIAREQAERANRVKDEFLAILSHELRTPLNPILGWTSLLRSGRLDRQKTAVALETIERNAKLQTQLIEDLLDISRILQGKLNLEIASVNITSTLEAAIEAVALAAEAKGIHLERDFVLPAPYVMGDANRLQQVVWNLLSNAVKFTPTGGQVQIQSTLIEQQVRITVSDTGKGIAAGFLPHVFDYFRQADSSTTRSFGGLGLGLAIARQIVELHGGTIQAASAGEGQGAIFTVQLPLSPIAMPVQIALPTATALPAQSILAQVRILVVDDEVDTRALAAYALEQCGAQVQLAASAQEALQIVQQEPPDLLITDIGMPDMDGYELIHAIRRLPVGGSIAAIALTAYAGESNQQQALKAGFQMHLSKPIEPADLIQAVLHLVHPNSK